MKRICLKTVLISFTILLVSNAQAEGATTCFSRLNPPRLARISSYDIATLVRDPIGAFEIEKIFEDLRPLLGNHPFPPTFHIRIVGSRTNVSPSRDLSVLNLPIGLRPSEKLVLPANKEEAVVVKAFIEKWLQLNWPEAPNEFVTFFQEASVATLFGETTFNNQDHALLTTYWNRFFSRMASSREFRRTLLAQVFDRVKARLSADPNPNASDVIIEELNKI